MKLIIAEKPSLAKTIVNALMTDGHTFQNQNGYFKSNEYVVTFAFGHLFGLDDFSSYDEIYKNWYQSYNHLPFVIKSFEDAKYSINGDDEKKQFEIIKDLIEKSDEVVHCGDSDREGEIIVRIILQKANCKKPVYRLWLPAQDEQSILDGLQNMQLDSDYNNLADEGFARQLSDYLYGFNLTRYCTVLSHELLQVGRIKVPMVQAIYERDKEIEEFIPQKYYQCESKKNGIELVSKEKFDIENEAIAYKDRLNQSTFKVSEIKKENKTVKPQKLFSLTTLQNHCSKHFKYSPADTLKIAQELYEKGLITYPRTNTEYLAESEIDKVTNLIARFNEVDLDIAAGKRCFDSAKVESHSALLITTTTAVILNDKQKQVYEAIMNRFFANFCKEPLIVEEIKATISSELESFKLTGKTVIQKGWLKFENAKFDKQIPSLNPEQIVEVDFTQIQKITQPKKHYTIETFNKFLENPYRIEKNDNDEDDDLDNADDITDYKAIMKGLEIGTVATRATTIEELIKKEYIALKKNSYYILSKGKFLIETLQKLNIDLGKQKTVELSEKLKRVYKGELSKADLLQYVNDDLKQLCDTSQKQLESRKKESYGKCLKCNSDVYKSVKNNKSIWHCSNSNCKFALFENMSHFQDQIKLNDSKVSILLKGGNVAFKLTSKSGTKYDAYLKLKINGEYVNFEQVGFVNKSQKKEKSDAL